MIIPGLSATCQKHHQTFHVGHVSAVLIFSQRTFEGRGKESKNEVDRENKRKREEQKGGMKHCNIQTWQEL